ncbi:hypothetical protein EWB00_005299 [Schistosoma japonicum]|uniref:Uncharacterized protein n=1 Tax=Schistosoma japonicum TaxID=6182 RepID=A0A4Z2D293_SCHJA|nr:hypothetical protein EWB00_005299 [Schistosoma japonicum]
MTTRVHSSSHTYLLIIVSCYDFYKYWDVIRTYENLNNIHAPFNLIMYHQYIKKINVDLLSFKLVSNVLDTIEND